MSVQEVSASARSSASPTEVVALLGNRSTLPDWSPVGLFEFEVTDDGAVVVAIRTTTPMCTLIGSLLQAAEEQIFAVAGVTCVDVRADPSLGWTERDMTAQGPATLQLRRAVSRAEVPIVRRQWAT